MDVRYAIVTGASPSSIGFHAAKLLSREPHRFLCILACRDFVKGESAKIEINADENAEDCTFLHLDLADMESIRGFVENVRNKVDGGAIKKCGLSLLVNNAGVGFGAGLPYQTTADGLEEVVGVNHFGHFLLTNLLLGDLKRAPGISRVVIVSSSMHDPTFATTPRENIPEVLSKQSLTDPAVLMQAPSATSKGNQGYNSFDAYQISKLCNIMFGYELQRKLDNQGAGTQVIVNSLCPGIIPWSGLTRRAGWFGKFVFRFVVDGFRVIFGTGPTRSWEDGGLAIFSVATGTHITEGGKHFSLPKGELDAVAKASSAESRDATKAKRLWDMSVKVCKL